MPRRRRTGGKQRARYGKCACSCTYLLRIFRNHCRATTLGADYLVRAHIREPTVCKGENIIRQLSISSPRQRRPSCSLSAPPLAYCCHIVDSSLDRPSYVCLPCFLRRESGSRISPNCSCLLSPSRVFLPPFKHSQVKGVL